ncbi:hypothetical protein Efla_007468 [Eimeria flavescens]
MFLDCSVCDELVTASALTAMETSFRHLEVCHLKCGTGFLPVQDLIETSHVLQRRGQWDVSAYCLHVGNSVLKRQCLRHVRRCAADVIVHMTNLRCADVQMCSMRRLALVVDKWEAWRSIALAATDVREFGAQDARVHNKVAKGGRSGVALALGDSEQLLASAEVHVGNAGLSDDDGSGNACMELLMIGSLQIMCLVASLARLVGIWRQSLARVFFAGTKLASAALAKTAAFLATAVRAVALRWTSGVQMCCMGRWL